MKLMCAGAQPGLQPGSRHARDECAGLTPQSHASRTFFNHRISNRPLGTGGGAGCRPNTHGGGSAGSGSRTGARGALLLFHLYHPLVTLPSPASLVRAPSSPPHLSSLAILSLEQRVPHQPLPRLCARPHPSRCCARRCCRDRGRLSWLRFRAMA